MPNGSALVACRASADLVHTQPQCRRTRGVKGLCKLDVVQRPQLHRVLVALAVLFLLLDLQGEMCKGGAELSGGGRLCSLRLARLQGKAGRKQGWVSGMRPAHSRCHTCCTATLAVQGFPQTLTMLRVPSTQTTCTKCSL